MKVAAGILTWNPVSHKRFDLLKATVDSLKPQVDRLVIADNGSTDETADLLASDRLVRFPRLAGHPHGNTCGYGMNKLAATLAQTSADILILSNDDIIWDADAAERLKALYTELSDKTIIVSGLVEPEFALPGREPWNAVRRVDRLGEDVWVRDSVPGGAWTFRRTDVPRIFPVSTFPGIDDVPACERLTLEGFEVAAVELAQHAGIGQSTWGNASHDRYLTADLETLKAGWL